MTYWSISCRLFTVGVGVEDDGTIRHTPPIVRRFVGQQLTNLIAWASTRGGIKVDRLP